MDDIYLKLTIRSLYRLNGYKRAIEKHKKQLEEFSVLNSIDYSLPRISPTFKVKSKAEEYIIRKYLVKKKIKSLQIKINLIETNLNKLPRFEKKILKLLYIENRKMKEISNICKCSYYVIKKTNKKGLLELRGFLFDEH